jgi:hypothetical protein
MLTSRERDSLITQQYWYIVAPVIVALLHYYVLSFPFVFDLVSDNYRQPLINTFDFLVLKVKWLFNPWYIIGIIAAGLTLFALGAKGVKSTTITRMQVRNSLLFGVFLLTAPSCLLWYYPHLFEQSYFVYPYIGMHFTGQFVLARGVSHFSRLLDDSTLDDVFNKVNQSFPQEERKLENQYSVNIQTRYNLKGKKRNGWINIINPFRGAMVLGTPGSGKSFVFIVAYIKQLIAKGFSMYIYDYKFDDLSRIAYNVWIRERHKYKVLPRFYLINFDNPHKSHRCNPLLPSKMTDITDAYESASTIMLNLNRSWISKQGDFFVESPINFVTSIIWFLKLYEKGKYCTFPHVIELLSAKYEEIFPILGAYPQIEVYVKPFVSAYENGAAEQLEGQIASARIGLARLASPGLYWVMSGNDFTLDINNPQEPKILCVGNNPQRQLIYGAALGLYNARLIKMVNQQHKAPSALIIDELATIFFKGLDQLIATARSNKVATLLGFQDFSQMERDYGKQEATVIENIIGNVFVGSVKGDTARKLSEQFGKINQKKQSVTTTTTGTSVSISTQLDYRIPPSVMAELSQGHFVGAVADNLGEEIALKVFHARTIVDDEEIKADQSSFVDIPHFNAALFKDEKGEDRTEEVVQNNYYRIRKEVKGIIERELHRISQDPNLKHLIKKKQGASGA